MRDDASQGPQQQLAQRFAAVVVEYPDVTGAPVRSVCRCGGVWSVEGLRVAVLAAVVHNGAVVV